MRDSQIKIALMTLLVIPSSTLSGPAYADLGEITADEIIARTLGARSTMAESLEDYTCTARARKLFFQNGEKHKLIHVQDEIVRIQWKRPDHFSQEVVGLRTSDSKKTRGRVGINLGIVEATFSPVIQVGPHSSVLSPLAPEAPDHYSYRLLDKVAVGDVTVYEIEVTPNNRREPLVEGTVSIDSASHSLVGVNFHFTPGVVLPRFLTSLRITMRHSLFHRTYWLNTEQRIEADVAIPLVFKGRVNIETELTDYRLNTGLGKDHFRSDEIWIGEHEDEDTSDMWSDAFFREDLREQIYGGEVTSPKPSAWQQPASSGNAARIGSNSFLRPLFTYNRVEGFGVGWGPRARGFLFRPVSLFGQVSYGLSDKEWKYSAGFEYGLKRGMISFGANVYRDLFSPDSVTNGLENTLSVLLTERDYRDYYRRKGWSARLGWNPSPIMRFRLLYNDEKHECAPTLNKGRWDDARPNPPVEEGKLRGLTLSSGLDTREFLVSSQNGWQLLGEIEYTDRGNLKSDFEYHRYLGSVQRTQRLTLNQWAVFRLKVGNSKHRLPVQKWWDVGGLGTMRGYDFKEMTGRRMWLWNLDYHFGGDIIRRLFSSWPWSYNFETILFADAGAATAENTWDFIEATTFDIGLALAEIRGAIRLELARRLDRSDAPLKLYLRLFHAF